MVPFNSLARNPSMPKSMLHSRWTFFLGWSQIPSFCSETYKMMSISAAFVTGKQAYVETLKLLWLDLTWFSCGIPGGPRGWKSQCSQRPWFHSMRSASCTGWTFSWHVYRIPYTNRNFATWKPKTSYFGTTISFKIDPEPWLGCQFRSSKKSTFLVRKPESLVARAGSLVICSWDFLGGAHPPKRKRRNIGRPSTNYVMMIFATLEKPFHLYTSCSANSRNSIKESCGSEGHQVSFMLWRLAGLLWIKISRLYRKDFCVFACLSQWGISHVHSSSLPISNLKSSFALQLQFNFKHVFQSKLFSLLQSHQVSLRQIGEARLLDLVGLLRPDDLCLENNGLGKQNGGNVKGFATCNMPRSLDNFRL